MPNLYSHGIEPIQKHEMIFAHTPTGSLWKHWDAEWRHHMGVIAVVDTRYMLMGILRPYDILHRLIQQRTSVHHLWPYTHVVEHSWADRLSDFDSGGRSRSRPRRRDDNPLERLGPRYGSFHLSSHASHLDR